MEIIDARCAHRNLMEENINFIFDYIASNDFKMFKQ